PSLKAPTARVASNIAPAATTRLAPRKARAIRATISRINPVMVHSRVGGERKTAVSVVQVLGAVEEHQLAPVRGQLRHGGVVLDVVEPAGGVVVQVVGDGDAEGGAVGHQHHVLVRVAVENLVDGRHHAVAHHALGFAPGGGEIRVAVELPGGAVENLDIVELDAL